MSLFGKQMLVRILSLQERIKGLHCRMRVHPMREQKVTKVDCIEDQWFMEARKKRLLPSISEDAGSIL